MGKETSLKAISFVAEQPGEEIPPPHAPLCPYQQVMGLGPNPDTYGPGFWTSQLRLQSIAGSRLGGR